MLQFSHWLQGSRGIIEGQVPDALYVDDAASIPAPLLGHDDDVVEVISLLQQEDYEQLLEVDPLEDDGEREISLCARVLAFVTH